MPTIYLVPKWQAIAQRKSLLDASSSQNRAGSC